MSPQEARLLVSAAQLCENMRAIYEDAKQARLPEYLIRQSLENLRKVEGVFGVVFGLYLRQLGRRTVHDANVNARPRTS